MAKSEIIREMLKQNIMKEVIFRIDYLGIISIENTLKEFETEFGAKFKRYTKTFNNRIDLGNIEFEQISESLSIPVKELQRLDIHRFTENTFGTDELTFDISNYYTVLHIKCKEYQNIDLYLDFFTEYVEFLRVLNKFVSFKRFGLRKIGFMVDEKISQLLGNFEETYFHTKVSNPLFGTIGNQYVDLLLSVDEIFNFTYRRVVDRGFIQNDDGVTDAMQIILDIDGYINEDAIVKNNFADKEQCKSLLRKLNDVYLFELFKISVTEKFLNNNFHERKQ